MLLRARIVLPISSPPIADGAVLISQNRVAAFGRFADFAQVSAGRARDLGEVILMPGLINAHCHLDYTNMAGQPAPKRFPDWIKGLVARKSGTTYSDYADAWLRGAEMLRRTGTTTVADIEAVPELLPDVWSSTSLRVISFLELTGVMSRRDPAEIVQEAADKISSLESERCVASLSPHAPYSTTPALLRQVAQVANRRKWLVTTHVAESVDEFDMFKHACGPMFDWLKAQRDVSDCGRGTPVQHLRENGLLGENFLAVHANYLEPDDIKLLAQSKSSVVHCPRSHSYFGHEPFLYEEMARAGVNICLGTDSLASVRPTRSPEPELNMFSEMRSFAKANPNVPPSDLLQLATRNGARALGLQRRVGEIIPDSFADLIAVPYGGSLEDAEPGAVYHRGSITHSMIDGKWTKEKIGAL